MSTTSVQPPPVVIEVHRTATPAADLPLVMVDDVARVLAVHGLDVELLAVSTALYQLILATPVDRGGAAPVGGGA